MDSLQELLSYRFTRQAWLETALTHRSFSKNNNERLEFLGDGVLNFVVAHHLFLARQLQLGEYLRLGPGELKSGGFRRDSILAGSLEAVIGAVYLDGGFDSARDLIEGIYRDLLASLTLEQGFKDPKTRLQEFLQGRGMGLPEYRVLSTQGDAHKQIFQVECVVVGDAGIRTQGSAGSRRMAEQEAAHKALAALGAVTEEGE